MKAIKQTQGLCCHYTKLEVNSSKRWILVVHGWDQKGRETWESTAANLNNLGFNVVLIDLPGFGQSESPEFVWGTDEYAGFLAQFLKELNIKPVLALGHGFGSAIVTKLSQLKGVGIKGLILVSPIHIAIRSRKNPVNSLKQIVKNWYYLAVKKGLSQKIVPSIRKLMVKTFKIDGYQEYKGVMNQIRSKIINEDNSKLLQTISRHFIIIWGAKDVYNPFTQAQFILSPDEIRHVLVYQDGHHQLQLTHSLRMAEDSVRFFDDHKFSFAIT